MERRERKESRDSPDVGSSTHDTDRFAPLVGVVFLCVGLRGGLEKCR